MASSARSHLNQVRKTVSEAFTFADTMAIAPELAELLAQVARCKVALGMAGSITVKRAQDAAGESVSARAGIDVGPISAADLDAMHTALQDTNRAPNADHKVEGLLKLMQSKPAVVTARVRGCFRHAEFAPCIAWIWTQCIFSLTYVWVGGESCWSA